MTDGIDEENGSGTGLNERADSTINLESPRSGLSIKRSGPSDAISGIPSSPPNFVSLEQLTNAANALYNMNLVHEITVDADFKIEHQSPDPQLKVIKETVHRAFWDLLREKLSAHPPDYSQAVTLLQEFKEALLGLLVSNQSSLRSHIEARFDIDAIKTELQSSGVVNLEEYGKLAIDLMSKMCAPARDEAVQHLRALTDTVEVFREAFAVLELMHMDMANYTIQQMRGHIRQHAVTYEKEAFAKLLETQRQSGIDGLLNTRVWLKTAFTRLREEITSQTGSDDVNRSQIPVPNRILAEAFVCLLTSPTAIAYPETLLMDQERLFRLRERTKRLACIGAIVMAAVNVLSKHVKFHSNLPPSADQSKQLLKLTLRDICRATIAFQVDEMARTHKPLELQSTKELMLGRVMKALEEWLRQNSSSYVATDLPTSLQQISADLIDHIERIITFMHPVFITLRKKAHEFLRMTLQSNMPNKMQIPSGFGLFESTPSEALPKLSSGLRGNADATSSSSSANGPINYDAVQSAVDPYANDGLVAVASGLLPIATHNRFVHGPYYSEIIQHLYAEMPEISKP